MATYRLNQFDGGTVDLPSGHWRWFVIRLNSLPEETCEAQQLIFANEDESGDIMRARVPNTINSLDGRAVLEYARNPDDREFRTSSGRVGIGSAVDEGRGRMWPVRPANGHPYRTSKFVEKALGDLTRSELTEIASPG
jgi:hypothetical protein